jgi:glyoxylase-like metal-dependent hydrolase (beta-lactamase superfamily II)
MNQSSKRFKKATVAFLSAISLLGSENIWAQETTTNNRSLIEQATQVPGFFRFKLGQMRITALYDGVATLPANFFKGISAAEVDSHWKKTHDYTPNGIEDSVNAYLIDTGKQLILVDAGGSKCFPGMGDLTSSLRQAGYAPNNIDAIFITHFHPDHGCGVSDENGAALYSNATVYVDEHEAAYWLSPAQTAQAPKAAQGLFLGIQKAIAPYQTAHRLKTFKAGETILGVVKSIAAYGHTPGHTVYQITSNNQTAIFWGDLLHSTQMQLENPNISFEYDNNQKQAAASRKKILAQAAKEQWLVGGAHIAFPGLGYVRRAGNGYEWTAVKYQSALK